MKFLCGNCKAKYQIADEKIAGRTLRMKCRRCNHDIAIRGDGQAAPRPAAARAAAARAAAPVASAPTPAQAQVQARRRGGSSVGPAPQRSGRRPAGSALGADFRRQVSAGAQPPERVATLEQWHVAINDVPVGPIRREEIARKVAAGAVTGGSLCWREGFDDWRPIREVPELAAVLRQRPAPPPPPSKPFARGAPAPRGTGPRPRPRPATRSGTGIPARTDSVRPAARSNVVPIGGRLGAAAAPAFDQETEDDFEGDATQVSDSLFDPAAFQAKGDGAAPSPFGALAATGLAEPGIPEVPGAAEASLPTFPAAPPSTESEVYRPAPRRGLPVGAWIAIAGAGAFGMMLAAMVGTKLLTDDPQPIVVVQPTPPPSETAGAVDVPDLADPEGQPEGAEGEETGEGDEGGETGARTTKRAAGGSAEPTERTPGKQLTAEQRALLDRFSEGGGASPSNIQVAERGGTAGRAGGEGLNAQQLTAVVSQNRPALRRCYETAIRGIGEPPTIRMDVDLTVGSSGSVSRVEARGNDVGGLASCIEGTVRRWRFPNAGGSTQTSFPVVFQPGS